MSELGKNLSKLIRDELAESQINKEKQSAEYRTGKMEAYMKILSVITEDIKSRTSQENIEKIDEQWNNINSIIEK
jgi:predicted house-cleaning noncanonical NTP pyrophosphatase (MazG superfamily)